MKPQEIKEIKKRAWEYLGKLVISPQENWLAVPAILKLSLLSVTPEKFIKQRPIGKNKEWSVVKAPYVPIDYIERALNFVSNRSRWFDIVEQWFESGDKYEARVKLKCWIELDDNKIERTVIWAWKSYKNPATSKFDCYKSAVSNWIKIFAKWLWIWADKADQYRGKIQEVRWELMKAGIDEVTEWFDSLPTNQSNND